MNQENLINLHYAYMGMIRHWHPTSERYTGADALFTALDAGWDMDDVVTYKEFWQNGMRRIVVCYFTLHRDDERGVMPVIYNPYVSRLIKTMHVKIVQTQTMEAISESQNGAKN